VVIGLTAMIGLLLALVLVVTAVVAARQRAGAAADLAALAAAAVGVTPIGAGPAAAEVGPGPVGSGPAGSGSAGPVGSGWVGSGGVGSVPGSSACSEAEVVAEANQVRLTGCRILGDGSVRVDVRATFKCGRWQGSVGGAARAGRVLRFRSSL
jgi:hypothetical protein